MNVLAAIRADSVNLPLFVHVLGAMLLVGTLFTAAVAITWGGRDGGGFTRFGLRTVLLGSLPAFLIMRIGAQWTVSEENLPKVVEDSTWVSIGYITGDVGLAFIIAAMVMSSMALKKDRPGLARAVGIISILLLVAYLVTVWAMSAKPE